MSSSTDSADNTSTCVEDKEGDDSTEDVVANQLALQIDHLSIENEGGDIPIAMASTNNAENNENITICAACGKEGEEDSMNICNKCKMVHYCNAACKKKQKFKHKKKCDRRVAELHDEALFSEPPLREECPICMLTLPLDMRESIFKYCCGKRICGGCIYGMIEEEAKRGKKREDWGVCAFCRTPDEKSDEEGMERLKKLMDNGNAEAFYVYACDYHVHATHGIPQDMAKATELWLKSGELGCADAYQKLGFLFFCDEGVVETDNKKAKHYVELAAMDGNVDARHCLGLLEQQVGSYQRAMKHYILAARAGLPESLDRIKDLFMEGVVSKGEFEQTLRTFHECQTEMKSELRDAAAELLKPSV